MDSVKPAAPQLAGLIPYDPKYLPADAFMSANENPWDVDAEIKTEILSELKKLDFNRYPDPLANGLRDVIAEANGLERDWVLIGNGGDDLLFNTALASGRPGRTFLNLPPTFSVYKANALLTNTDILDIPRLPDADFSIDEEAVISALSDESLNISFTIIASPNNPTGKMAKPEFLDRLLQSTDALVMVDEAYFEFSRYTMRPYLEVNKNLVILRTFSKAFSLAGVRLGYILANPSVIEEYLKVRQPYSVDAVSQTIGRVVYEHRSAFEPAIAAIISERDRLIVELAKVPGVRAYKSDSNWVLFKMEGAQQAWEYLYGKGILIRDFSSSDELSGCLRVTVGTKEQNDAFLSALKEFATRPARTR